MKAVVFEDINKLQLHNDYPKPECKKGWVVIKVMAAGVCATDLDIVAGDFGNPPVVIGHEICGDIVEVGEGVKNFKVGDRVVVETVVKSCGHCEYCLNGNKHLCKDAIEIGFPNIDGGYEQYTTCPESCLHKLKDNISYDEGGILEAVLCPYGLIYRYGIKENEIVFIQGTGVAGLSFIQTVKMYNPKKIIVAVRRKESVDLAYKYGADVVINTSEEDLEKRLLEESDGLGPSLSIDAAGAKKTIEDAVKLTAKGGRVILYGLPRRNTQIDFPVNDIILKQITVLGGTNNELAWDALIDDISKGKINIKDFVSKTFKLEDYEKAIALLKERPNGFIKAVLHPWEE